MIKKLKIGFANNKKQLSLYLSLVLLAPGITQAAIGISTPSVSSGELIRAADWNKVKLDLETLAAAVGVIQNSTWGSSGSDTYYDSGNVGIGLNAPTGTLHVFADTPAANAVLLQLGTTDDADRVRIDEDGDMTIDGKLVVRDSDIYESGGDIEISGEDNLYLSLDWNNNDADTNVMYFGKNSPGAGGSFVELMRLTEAGDLGVGVSTPLSSIHTVGGIQIGGDADACVAGKAGALRYDGGAVERCNGTNWDALATTNVSDNLGNHIAELNIDLDAFRLVGEGGSEGLAVDGDGSVGIGTDNPITLLDVASDEEASVSIRTTAVNGQNSALVVTGAQTTSTTADIASIRLTNKDGSPFEGARISLRNGDATDASAQGDLVFSTNTGGSDNLTEKMRILDDGKVGIGTSGPVVQLQVVKNTPVANEVVFQVGTNADLNRFSVDEDGDVFNDGNYYVGGGNVLTNNGSVTFAGEDNLYLVTDWNNNDAENRSIIFGKNGVGGGGGFSELVRINENGRLGINENNPANALHVGVTETTDRVAVIENLATTGSPEGLLVLTGQAAGPAPAFAVGTGVESSHTNNFVVTNEGKVGIQETNPGAELHVKQLAQTSANGVRIESASGGNTGRLWVDAAGSFNLQRGTNTNQLVLAPDGNVGIGTASPKEVLNVQGSGTDARVSIDGTGTSSFPGLELRHNNSENSRALIRSSYTNGSNQANLEFITSAGSPTESMRIQGNGNVGIGTTSPSQKLSVDGNLWLTDNDRIMFESTTGIAGQKDLYVSGNNAFFTDVHFIAGYSVGLRNKRGDLLGMESDGTNLNFASGDAQRMTLDGAGELEINSVSSDGTGKVVCIKGDGNLGTCTNAPNGSGVCNCS